jgi:hypothetical protein
MKPLRLHPQRCKKSVQKNLLGLHRQLRLPGALRPPPIDAFQQHRQLRSCQGQDDPPLFLCLVGCRRTVTSEAQAIAYQLCIAVLKGPEGH